MSNFLELAKARRSVRTFEKAKLDFSVLNELKQFSGQITNPYGIPVKFVFLDKKENDLSSPVLAGESKYVSAVVKKGEHVEEAYGYSFEALLMRAHEMGLGTVWIGGTMPREKFETATGLAANDIMPCMSPLGIPAQNMSVKEILMRKGVKADNRKNFEELFFEDDFNTPLTEDKAESLGLKEALESVRVAPSAVNKQPWRVVITENAAHFYVRHDKGFVTPDYDLQKIDVGIGMYHFDQVMSEEGKKLTLEVSDPKIETPAGIDYVATFRW